MKNFSSLFKYSLIYAKNYLLESLAIYFPKVVPKPLYVGFSVGTLCNFRCRHCDLWRIPTNPKKYLKTAQIIKILKNLRNWLGPFRLTFTGAEPLLRKDILEIVSFAAKNDIETILTTNGWFIDQKLAKKIVKSGLDMIAISLDGALPKTHDFLRGKKGSCQKAVESLNFLVKARKDKSKPHIYINTVIMADNLEELVDLVRLAKKKGIDGIRFEALESKYLFGDSEYNPNWFKDNPLWPGNTKKVKLVINGLIKLKKQGYPVKNTFKELEDLKSYYKDPAEIAKRYRFCFTGVRNFAIDEYGDVKLCFGMEPVGNILKQKPEDIWYGKEANKLREEIRNCRRYCRILPCNKREELSQFYGVFLKRLTHL